MVITKEIILIQRDGGRKYVISEISENGQCYLKCATDNSTISVSLFRILNALNTPNGAWNIDMNGHAFLWENDIWVRGKMLSVNGREGIRDEGGPVTDIIGINECGHERQLNIRRSDQIKVRCLI